MRAQRRAGDRRDRATGYVELYAAYDEQCQREGVVDFAELLLRSLRAARAQRDAARALLAALPPHPGRRVPGHQPPAVPLAQAARRARDRSSSRSATTTSRSMPSAARTSATWPTSSATSTSKQRDRAWSRTTARTATSSTRPTRSSRTTASAWARTCGPRTARASRCACSKANRTSRRRAARRGSAGAAARRHAPFADRRCCTARTPSRACSSMRSSRRAFPTGCTAACAFSSAPRSSTRSPTCAWSPPRTTTTPSCASSTFRRAASARAPSSSSRTPRKQAGASLMKAAEGTKAAAFKKLTDDLRAEVQGLPLARADRGHHRAQRPHRALQDRARRRRAHREPRGAGRGRVRLSSRRTARPRKTSLRTRCSRF